METADGGPQALTICVGFVFHAARPEGIDVTLRVRGEGPLPLRIVAYRGRFPRVPEFTPRPEDVRCSAASSNLTMVTRTYGV